MSLSRLPRAEIAVQCHPSKMSSGMPRNVWFEQLLRDAKLASHIHLAIHINAEWAYDICARGIIPDIILDWIKIERTHNNPLIKRIQLNMSKDTADNIDINGLRAVLYDFRHQEFIFQYNDKTKDAIEKLHKTNAKFSLLFDASGGNGISPENWQKPIYENHPMGYSGGISPTNVMQNLSKIRAVVGDDTPIWIDAEGKLKSQNLFDEKALFDVELAKAYVRRANVWQKQH
jgi:hypothetical protein